MNKKIRIIGAIIIMALFVTTTVFADEKAVIKNVSGTILSMVSWFGYAIALVSLIFIGMKYVMSGANERADLKGKIQLYLIGIALIVLCSTIAQGVAITAGNENAETIVNRGIEIAGAQIEDKKPVPITDGYTSKEPQKLVISGTDNALVEIKYDGKTVEASEGLEWEISQYENGMVKPGTEFKLTAPLESKNGMVFDYWAIVDDNGNVLEVLSNEKYLYYTMPDKPVNIQAIYKDPNKTPTIPDGSDPGNNNAIVIQKAGGGGSTNLNVAKGTKLAVITASNATYTADFSIRNIDKTATTETNPDGTKSVKGNVTKDEIVGDYTVNRVELGTRESDGSTPVENGEYMISIVTNGSGMEEKQENVHIYRYDEYGKRSEVTEYDYTYIEGGADIIIDLDFDSYSYAIIVTEEGIESK